MPPAKAKRSIATYPWAELYDLESRTEAHPPRKQLRRGRPNRPIERTRVTLELTDEELDLLLELQSAIRRRFAKTVRVSTVSRGQVDGLALRLLKERLLTLGAASPGGEIRIPDGIDDWQGLVEWLRGKPE